MNHNLLNKFKTDLFPICMGTGDFFWDAACSEAKKISLLASGIQHGINIIDTAAEYGNGFSEHLVQKAIKGKRDQLVICTKVSPQNLGFRQLIDSAEQSLRRLGVDIIDILTIHWPNPNVPIEETSDALLQLIEDDKVCTVGLANFTPSQVTIFKL